MVLKSSVATVAKDCPLNIRFSREAINYFLGRNLDSTRKAIQQISSQFRLGDLNQNIVRKFEDLFGHLDSYHMVAEDRNVSGFHGIDVGGIYQVEITAQKEYSVRIEADDNLLPLIKTEVDGGTLKIESERRISPKSKIRIIIGAPNIDNLEVSGVANVTLNDLKNFDLKIDSSGASKIKLTGETAKLTIDVSGAHKDRCRKSHNRERQYRCKRCV